MKIIPAFLIAIAIGVVAWSGSLDYNNGRSVPRWVDALVPASATKVVGANEPTWTVVKGGVALPAFSKAAGASQQKELFFTLQFPHAMVTGAPVSPHIHFTPDPTDPPAVGETVTWGIEYWLGQGNQTMATAVVTNEATYTFTTTNQTHVIFGLTPITNSAIADSAIVVGRIYRKTGDSYTGRAFLMYQDWHCKVQDFGSFLEYGDNN